jgi:hypothetical protein
MALSYISTRIKFCLKFDQNYVSGLGATTLSIMTLSIMTLSTRTLSITLNKM